MNNDNIKVYEVHVFAVAEGVKDMMLGSWRGMADSELKAKELAESDVWEQRFTDDGFSPSHALRVVPRYLVADRWFHSFDGANEGIIRWTYDRGEGTVEHAAAMLPGGTWAPLTRGQQSHLDKALVDVLDIDGNPDDIEGVLEMEALPTWCAADPAPKRRPKP